MLLYFKDIKTQIKQDVLQGLTAWIIPRGSEFLKFAHSMTFWYLYLKTLSDTCCWI